MIKPLTSFRFIAAAAVVLAHFGYPYSTGGVAVAFFFLLSGFILAHNYVARFESLELGAMVKLWVFRIARIWPLHLLMFFVTLPLMYVRNVHYSAWQTLANVFLVHAWYPDGVNIFSYNGVSWSISDELFFYISLPFLLYGFNRLRVARSATRSIVCSFVAGLVLLVIAYVLRSKSSAFNTEWWLMMVSPYVRIFDFVIGMCLGMAFNRLEGARRNWYDTHLFTVLEMASIAFLVVLFQSNWNKWGTLANGAYYTPAMMAIVFVFAFQRGIVSKLLSNRVMIHLGEISFSLYMVHQPIIYYIDLYVGPTVVYAKDMHHAWGQVLISIGLIAVADCVYRYVELPARNYVRSLMSAKPSVDSSGIPVSGY